MKRILLSVLLISSVFSVAFAQDDIEKKEAGKPMPKDVQAIQTANMLAKYGYANYSSSSLIEAAKILSQVTTQDLKTESVTKSEEKADTGTKTEKKEFTPKNLLEDAKKFANGDATLLAMAEKVEKGLVESTRGRVGGPGEQISKVYAGCSESYVVKFWAGEPAIVYVSGDGDTDVDLYVYDQNGNLIDRDIDYTDECVVQWTPKWTGPYVIKIVNRGSVYNRYVIVTN